MRCERAGTGYGIQQPWLWFMLSVFTYAWEKVLTVTSALDVAGEMEYDERLALFRQTRLNPFDRGEDEDGPQEGKTPPQHGKVISG